MFFLLFLILFWVCHLILEQVYFRFVLFFHVLFHFLNPFSWLWNRLQFDMSCGQFSSGLLLFKSSDVILSLPSPAPPNNSFIWNLTFVLFCCLFFMKNLFYFPKFLERDEIQGSFPKSKDSPPLLFLCNIIKKEVRWFPAYFPPHLLS